jgi:NAD(P)-dependent dehydrogenase (short-subunit alcohol dehydrogenase family)
VALASRGITVNAISPGVTEDSILNILPPPTRRAGPDTLLAAGWLDQWVA